MMDFLPDYETFSLWLVQYGNLAFFILLILGIVALPVPEETLMVLAGVMIAKGNLHPITTPITALFGSICGISLSYYLGRTAGTYFVNKYGSWIGITNTQLTYVQSWFERFGKWVLFIGYFIPGIRHFTGFSVGMTNIEFRQFALYAYSGALAWVTTFLSIGYFFGDYFLSMFENIEFKIDEIIIALAIVCFAGIIYFLFKRKLARAQ